ncbi:hypothetical protein CXG81DRAFT_11402 [Caulochytrium protostelioides]|uniref:Copper transport protein n=1 Tax=Caulochytrium protostelioides TaxID=1555241 RepID=A0A4P9X994_9FUNG|nr:hypothetical protein CXG81DRAFT_11402 [Caulochytrium protostelioides]|eukprot:RKP01903.1 hypothetical protein CXG81DRAFT_11402 [Caulochytrium protostelioides]
MAAAYAAAPLRGVAAAASSSDLATASGLLDTLCAPSAATSRLASCALRATCTDASTSSSVAASVSCSDIAIAHHACTVDAAFANTNTAVAASCTTLTQTVCAAGGSASVECAVDFGLPATLTLQDDIFKGCNAMTMDGCDRCAAPSDATQLAACDVLSTSTQICRGMGGMTSCNGLANACMAHTDLPALGAFCRGVMSAAVDVPSSAFRDAATSGAKPRMDGVMRMYLHTEINDYVLFRSLVPQNQGQYFGVWLLTFGIALLLAGIDKARRMWSARVRRHTAHAPMVPAQALPMQSLARDRLIQALIRTLEVIIAYLLMLIVMTFNVGLLFAAGAGVFVGSLLWEEGPGELRASHPDEGPCNMFVGQCEDSQTKYCH